MSRRDYLKAKARELYLKADAFRAEAVAELLNPDVPEARRQDNANHSTAMAMQYLDRADQLDAEAEAA